MKLEELVLSKKAEIQKLANYYGASNVRVFGSVARGEDDQDSDVDLLVDLEPGRSLMDLGGLQFELQRLLGVKVDVATCKSLRPRVRHRALEEAVAL